LPLTWGSPYAFAYFFSDGVGVEQALEMYRSQFRPSPYLDEPYATICVSALAADTQEDAWYQFQSRARWRMDRNRGRIRRFALPEDAVKDVSPQEMAEMMAMRETALVGNPVQAADKLRALAKQLELDELVVCTWTHDPAVQLRSFELLASAAGLMP
jgi:alkanesulfonate monooxygenase SsuD/methylene tetrahydromethanopterin reductase-like flavin-dependent oxidoreductase (luciferase family)